MEGERVTLYQGQPQDCSVLAEAWVETPLKAPFWWEGGVEGELNQGHYTTVYSNKSNHQADRAESKS